MCVYNIIGRYYTFSTRDLALFCVLGVRNEIDHYNNVYTLYIYSIM